MIPTSANRVLASTPDSINALIFRQTEDNVRFFGSAGPDAIAHRLDELDEEWDIERVIEANASTLALLGLTLGATVSRKWFILPALVTGFLLQHAIQGWCPPVPVLRRLGVRTRSEIDYERYALRALRGDFKDAETLRNETEGSMDVQGLMHAVRM